MRVSRIHNQYLDRQNCLQRAWLLSLVRMYHRMNEECERVWKIEALIQQRLHSGAFESVEDVLFDALEVQAEREAWLQENKEAINAKIERGLAQLDKGEGIPGEDLRRRLEADKAAWLADRSGS